MNYQNLYHQTKVANVSEEEGQRLGWRTTSQTKPMIIGFLKNAIENEDVWIPSRIMIDELMNYVADTNGKTNAITGHHDDTVVALAIALEILRTHGHKLTNTRVPWSQQVGNYQQEQKGQWL